MARESGKNKKNLTETKKRVYKKKRTDLAHEVDKSNQLNNKEEASPKPRMKWDDYKHKKFLSAVQLVGIGASPAKILEVMNMEGVTRLHVASHIQKFRLRVAKLAKEPKVAALRASSRDGLIMQEAVSIPSLVHNWRHTSGTKKEANSPTWIAPTTIGNDRPSTPYHFGLTYLNQLHSEHNNQMAINHSPHTQSNFFVPLIDLTDYNFYEQQQNSGASYTTQLNFNTEVANSSWPSNLSGTTCTQSNSVEWPAVNGRRNVNNISNNDANVETLHKNPSVPLVDLTHDDIGYQPQQIGGAFITSQLNFGSGASSNWPSNLSTAATHTPTSGDGLRGLTWGGIAVNEQNDVQNVVVQNPDGDLMFVNPVNIPDMMSATSSEQNIIYAGAVDHDSYNNTVMPSAEDPSVGFGEDLTTTDDGFLINDELDGFFNIGVESSEWNYILDLDLPYYHQEWNSA